MANPFQPGFSQGMYCSVDFEAGGQKQLTNVEVATLIGKKDLSAVYNAIKEPREWCTGWRDECERYEGPTGWYAYP